MIGICLVTYNRLDYTKKTLRSITKTIGEVPHVLVVVDNNSTDGTQEWLLDTYARGHYNIKKAGVICNTENYYPGKATNLGWEQMLDFNYKIKYLARIDNDMVFEKDWAKKAIEYFEKMPNLGQLGIDYEVIENAQEGENYNYRIRQGGMEVNSWPGNIGGPCIIRRELWDKGLRYDETPWQATPTNGLLPAQEDVKLSLSVKRMGYEFGHATEKLATTFANQKNWKDFPEYYKKTMVERGYPDPFPND